jgi:hypothetical protein
MAVAVVAVTTAMLVAPGTAQAAPGGPNETKAVCHVEVPQVKATPGFSATPVTGTGTSAPGATILCFGKIRGAAVVGDPGPLAVSFEYGTGPLSSLTGGATCLAGSGDGTVFAALPDVEGNPIILKGPILFGFLGPVAAFHGHFDDLVFAGVAEPLPDLAGVPNCVTTPITAFSIRGQFGMKNL